MSNASDSPRTDKPVIPVDLTRASYHSGMGDLPLQQPHTTQQTRSSSESCGASLKSPRTARFAEATTVHSPIESSSRSPFADPPQKQNGGVGDVGFGYVAVNHPAQYAEDSRPPMTPALASPLRSGLKVPNTAKSLNPLSPTFREEYILEKQEKVAEKENARDLVSGSPAYNINPCLNAPYLYQYSESNFGSASPRSSSAASTSHAV